MPELLEFGGRCCRLGGECVGQAGFDAGRTAGLHGLDEQAFEVRRQSHDLDFVAGGGELLCDGAAERNAHLRREFMRILRAHAVLGDSLQDGAHVADVHALFEQRLQCFLQHCQRNDLGNQVLDDFRRILADMVEQLLYFLAPEKLGGMLLHDVIQMRCDHGAGIHDGVAEHLRVFALGGFDPDRR